jgi:hypothetical protein
VKAPQKAATNKILEEGIEMTVVTKKSFKVVVAGVRPDRPHL